MMATSGDPVDNPVIEQLRPKPIKRSRFAKFEGVIVSRERGFGDLSTIITAIFTVVLALSTVLLWKIERRFVDSCGHRWHT
jgi:hypothetical protein